MPYAARTMWEKNGAICWALDRWMSRLSAWEGALGELEDELEEELEDELEELEKLKELEEDVHVGRDVVVVEGLWTFLGLSQPNLLKPLTGRA